MALQHMMRMKEQQQAQVFRNPNQMIPGQMGRLTNMRGNGVVPPNLQKTVLQNNTGGLYVFPPVVPRKDILFPALKVLAIGC